MKKNGLNDDINKYYVSIITRIITSIQSSFFLVSKLNQYDPLQFRKIHRFYKCARYIICSEPDNY